jgi:hypothetical protein
MWGIDWRERMPLGAVVAIGRLSACAATFGFGLDNLTKADFEAGNFTPGRYAWRVDEIHALAEPIPLTGRQGLFNWTPPADLAERLTPVGDHVALCKARGWA